MNVAICVRYFADSQTDVLAKYIDNIHLYFFNDKGNWVCTKKYNLYDFQSPGKTSPFRLHPGKYKLVALGNKNSFTEFRIINDLYTAIIESPLFLMGKETVNHDYNYLGYSELIIPDDYKNITVDTVDLSSSHIKVDLEINGLPSPVRSSDKIDPVSVRIIKANAQTLYNNQVVHNKYEDITPELLYDESKSRYYTDKLSLFRMDEKGLFNNNLCKHELQILDRNKQIIYSIRLIEFIEANFQYIKLTNQEAYLPIAINFIDTGIEIRLPQWYIEDIKPDWN